MEDRDPTARAREIGLILENAAKEARLSQAELSRWLGWSQSRVSRVFSGTRPPGERDVVAIAAICRVMGDDRAHLLKLAKQISEPTWLQEYGTRLPARLRTLVGYEEVAAEITDFETSVVPGLLQTPDYARAVLSAQATIPRDEVDDRVAARIARQNIYSQEHRPVCYFFMEEFALLRTGPGRQVMSDQLYHLIQMSVRPYINLRIIPDAVGFHSGRKSFRLMEFHSLNPVVFLEAETGVQFLQQKDTVAAYRQIIDQLGAIALSEGQSREWLVRLASTLGASREEHDDLAEEQLFGGNQLR
jgi:transcriptional regulator with XRE-family HTH domain